MQIRSATVSDAALVAQQRLAFLAEVRSSSVEVFDDEFVAATTAWVTQCLQDGTVLTWLAKDKGKFAGMVSLQLQPTSPVPGDLRTQQGYVINMFVLPASRGNGLGRSLMAAVLDAAPSLKVRKISLIATPDGRPLYEDLGFASDHRFMTLPVDRSANCSIRVPPNRPFSNWVRRRRRAAQPPNPVLQLNKPSRWRSPGSS